MGGYVFHSVALGEQIINITRTGIINNLSNPVLGHLCCFRDLFLGPSKAAAFYDNAVSVCSLTGTDIRDPCVDGLLAFVGSGVDGWVPGQVFDFYGFYDFHFFGLWGLIPQLFYWQKT